MRVVTLVPWRPSSDRYRQKAWGFIQPHLESLGYPLFTGDSTGPWARSAAVNNAAAKAETWDAALITDADTWLDGAVVRAAVARVSRTRGASRPHSRRWMLTVVGSRILMEQGPQALTERLLRLKAPGGGALVIHRQAWDKIGGFDERFIEWGHEDSAMNMALVGLGVWEITPGDSYHLWHPLPNKHARTTEANRALMEQYRERYKEVIAIKSVDAGFDLNEVL